MAFFSKMASGGWKKTAVAGGKEVAEMYRATEDMRDVAQGFITDLCKSLDNCFVLPNNKVMKLSHRELVMNCLEMPMAEWDDFLKPLVSKADDITNIKNTSETLKKFLGESKNHGLFVTFGTDPEKFITEYFPVGGRQLQRGTFRIFRQTHTNFSRT